MTQMDTRRNKTIASWFFVYAALFAAVVLVGHSATTPPPDVRVLSPVILSDDAPALRVEAIVQRSDI